MPYSYRPITNLYSGTAIFILMRIAIVAEPFVPIPPKRYGGIERVIANEIKGLQELGHEVTLLAPGDSKVECELIPICKKHIRIGKSEKE